MSENILFVAQENKLRYNKKQDRKRRQIEK